MKQATMVVGGKFHYFHNFFTFLLILSFNWIYVENADEKERKKSQDFNIFLPRLHFPFFPFLQSSFKDEM